MKIHLENINNKATDGRNLPVWRYLLLFILKLFEKKNNTIGKGGV